MANQQTFVTVKEFKAYQKYCDKIFRAIAKDIKNSLKKPAVKKKSRKTKSEVVQ